MSLKEKMTALADAVRKKAELIGLLTIDEMTAAVTNLVVGGTDISDATVTGADLRKGVTAYGANGKVTGTIPTVTPFLSANVVTVPQGYIAEEKTITVGRLYSGSPIITPGVDPVNIGSNTYFPNGLRIAGDPDLSPENIRYGKSLFGVEGAFTYEEMFPARSELILSGYVAYVNGERLVGTSTAQPAPQVSGNVVTIPTGWNIAEYNLTVGTTKEAETYTPGTSDITIPADSYLAGDLTIKGDVNLSAANIAKGVTIFGITGEFNGGAEDATVTASDLLEGVIAYGAEGKITGTIPTVTPSLEANVVTVPQGYISQVQTLTVPEMKPYGVNSNVVTIHPGYNPEIKAVIVGTLAFEDNITPGTADVVFPRMSVFQSELTIKGDANLISKNIKAGVTVFDVEGTFTSDADAAAEDIAKGKTAYVNGEKVTGNLEFSYYKCAFVDTERNTWKGYKAILSNGVYHFSDVLSVLSYGEGFTPSVNGIYDKKALVQVKSLYQGVDQTLIFHAPLQSESTTAATGQTMAVSGNVEYRDIDSRKCAYFDGNSKLVITDVSALPFGSDQHTICGWFRYSAFNPYSGLLGYGYEYAIRSISPSGESDVVYYENTGGAFSYYLESDRWYHIATTWDGVTLRLYIDGAITSTNSEAPSFYRSEGNPLWIGGVPRTGTAHGYVSDVRIYTRALSEEEIAAAAAS